MPLSVYLLEALEVALIVKLCWAILLEDPDMVPEEAFKVNPVGRLPADTLKDILPPSGSEADNE